MPDPLDDEPLRLGVARGPGYPRLVDVEQIVGERAGELKGAAHNVMQGGDVGHAATASSPRRYRTGDRRPKAVECDDHVALRHRHDEEAVAQRAEPQPKRSL